MKNLTEMFVTEAASLAEKAKKLYRDYNKIDKELENINQESFNIIKNTIDNTEPSNFIAKKWILLPEPINVVKSKPRDGELFKANAVSLGYIDGTVTVGLIDANGKWQESVEYDHIKYYTSVVATIADQLK